MNNREIALLVREFRENVIRYDDYTMPRRQHNDIYKRHAEASEKLSRTEEGRKALRDLLRDKHPAVRCWAAGKMLSDFPDEAKPVLDSLADDARASAFIRISARTSVREYQRSKLPKYVQCH